MSTNRTWAATIVLRVVVALTWGLFLLTLARTTPGASNPLLGALLGIAVALHVALRDISRNQHTLESNFHDLAARYHRLEAERVRAATDVSGAVEEARLADRSAELANKKQEESAMVVADLRANKRLLEQQLKASQATLLAATKQTDATRAESARKLELVAVRYLEAVGALAVERMTPAGLERGLKALEKAVEWLQAKVGVLVAEPVVSKERARVTEEHAKTLSAQAYKEEQGRIKDEMREEAKIAREQAKLLADAERDREEAERQERDIQQAMERVRAEMAQASAADLGAAEAKLSALQAQLALAEQQLLDAERAKSQAQLTTKGHVYVISNLGSFGDGVFKVGMTRRLVPMDRVDELGDASVPFEFDVHAMIYTEDAPKLERDLHRDLHRTRMNKINLRKEFFRVPLGDIVAAVERNHGQVVFQTEFRAEEYRASIEKSLSGLPDPYIPELDGAGGEE